MHQRNKEGGGESNDEVYITWTTQECPTCGRLVKEYYSARVITEENESH